MAEWSFKPERAERVRDFFHRFIRHSDGKWKGKPFTLLPWQWENVIQPIFGRIRDDGTRLIRKGYIGISKKNGKSELMAGLALYMLLADDEPSSEVYIFASDRDQATLIFKQAAKMVDGHPQLFKRLKVLRTRKRIVDERTNSFIQAEDSDAPGSEGLNAHCVIIDELHAQKGRDLFDSLRYSGAARRQPLQLSITTAGWDRESICYEEYQHAKRVQSDPTVDPTYHAAIYEAESTDDWNLESTWRKANPSLGVTIDIEEFQSEFGKAKRSPSIENAFRRYRLNQWTQQASRWINLDDWLGCGADFTEDDLQGQPCYGGLDLASTTDVSALALVFPVGDGAGCRVLNWFWMPGDAANKRHGKNGAKWLEWAKAGYVELTPGAVTDYAFIRRKLNGLATQFDLQEIAIDRWNATQLALQLRDDGMEVVAFGQGFKDMSPPTKALEGLVLSRSIQHNNNPVMQWMIDNVAVERDAAGNVKPSKAASTEKIDGVVAAIMGIGRMTLQTEFTNVYESGNIPDIWETDAEGDSGSEESEFVLGA